MRYCLNNEIMNGRELNFPNLIAIHSTSNLLNWLTESRKTRLVVEFVIR